MLGCSGRVRPGAWPPPPVFRLSACLGELGEALHGAGPRELCRQQGWGLGEGGETPQDATEHDAPKGCIWGEHVALNHGEPRALDGPQPALPFP